MLSIDRYGGAVSGAPMNDRVALAALADAGWPALERAPIGGWVARFASGVTSRANSVYPAGTVQDVPTAIAEAERQYRGRGLHPLFQLSDDDVSLQRELLARGYTGHSETLVMTAGIDGAREALASATGAASSAAAGPGSEIGDTLEIADAPDDAWLRLWWSVDGRGGDHELEVARRIVTGGSALYATIRDEHGAASVGRLALVEHDGTLWGGLYALATRPDARSRGHAHAAIRALADAGAALGVSALWLQVLESNAVARRLYDRLGFEHATTYRYLTAPD